jgi:hypothetical protein
MNTQITRNHLIALGIVVIGLFLLMQVIIPDEEIAQPVVTAEQESLEIYKDNFNYGCMEEGATYKQCNCMFNELYNKLGKDQLLKESIDYNLKGYFSDKMTGIMSDAIIKCY